MTLFLPYYTAEYAHNREEMEGYYSNVEISFEAPRRILKGRLKYAITKWQNVAT